MSVMDSGPLAGFPGHRPSKVALIDGNSRCGLPVFLAVRDRGSVWVNARKAMPQSRCRKTVEP